MTPTSRKRLIIAGAVFVLVCAICLVIRRYYLQPPPGPTLQLSSTSFQADTDIPAKFTCDGQDVSPELAWGNPPTETRSFAVVADDPDAPTKTVVHWVLYNVPGATRSLPEGLPKDATLPDGSRQGRNDRGSRGYSGPCPPRGPTHHYFFKLYALDSTIDLKPDAGKEDLEHAMEGHILAQSQLIGRFHH